MKGKVTYRQLVLSDNGEVLRLPLTAPVNDLLGLLRGDETYLAWVLVRYSAFGKPLGEGSRPEGRQAFLKAAKAATTGHVSRDIATQTERVRFAPDGTADVPDFTALAAWSLLEAVRRQPLKLRTCAQCKRQWLARPDESLYCQRVAPGQVRMDCRTFAKERRLAGDNAYRRYRREYKRLSEAQRRGSIEIRELVNWREQNGPADWLPFDEWKALQTKEEQHG
jgi:hypothetical protein